jgi:predicted transcriptional regulator
VNNWRIVSQERKRKEIFSDILGIATAKDSSSKKEVKKEAKTEVKQEEVK